MDCIMSQYILFDYKMARFHPREGASLKQLKPTMAQRPVADIGNSRDALLFEENASSHVSLTNTLSRAQSSIVHIIQSSVSVLKETVQKVTAVFVGEDGCGLRHCRAFVLVASSFLGICAIWAILLWINDIAGLHFLGERHWVAYFQPNVPLIGSQLSVGLACMQPLVSSAWLVDATYRFKYTELHWYLKITPWLMIHPFFVMIYFILYYGRITTAHPEIMLKTQVDLYNPSDKEEVEEWQSIHRQFECCGIRHWSDWANLNEFEVEKVPRTCCKEEPRHATYDESKDCPWFPTDNNTFSKGCYNDVYRKHSFWVGSTLSAIICSLIFTSFSIFAASQYYERKIQETQPNYVFTWHQGFSECICPRTPYPVNKASELDEINAESAMVDERRTLYRHSKVHPSSGDVLDSD